MYFGEIPQIPQTQDKYYFICPYCQTELERTYLPYDKVHCAACNQSFHKKGREVMPDLFSLAGKKFDAIADTARFDLIVSNPPYVVSDEISSLEPDVYQYEPTLALDGGTDGLTDIALIIQSASRYLKPGGNLFLEIGYDQGTVVNELGQACRDYDQVVIEKDYSGHDRLVRMRKTTREDVRP